EAIEHDPERAPDFGPARLSAAGATIVGARPPLIAFNVYLNTSDVRIAQRVAKAVRASSGGLRGGRALGLLVGGRAQVSMNLIDYRNTPLHRAVELVAREAAAYGASIAESELVGLIPEDALLDAARFYLQLHTMREDQVLERRLVQRLGGGGSGTGIEGSVLGSRFSVQEEIMEPSRKLTIEALGATASELAVADLGDARARLMLQALGRELRELAAQPGADSPRSAARALLLAAERAAKVAEIAAGMREAGDERVRAATTSAIKLAQALAAGAQARAEPL